MPPNAIYVGRPSRWGNPYTLVDTYGDREELLRKYTKWLEEKDLETFLAPLIGKDLACWCSLDKSCHADILLDAVKQIVPLC